MVAKCPKKQVTATPASANKAEEGKGAETAEKAGNASTIQHAFGTSADNRFDWNTDSGATSHMTPHRHWFKTYTKMRKPVKTMVSRSPKCMLNGTCISCLFSSLCPFSFLCLIGTSRCGCHLFLRTLCNHVPFLSMLRSFVNFVTQGYKGTVGSSREFRHLMTKEV